MALDTKDLLEIGRGKGGTLAATPFPVLLQALFLAERTGVLELKQRNLEKRIALEEGVPVDATSNLLHETPARFLVEKKKLDEEGYQKALTESAIAGERIEQTLLRLQLVSPFDLFKLLQQNLALKVLDCFCSAWSDAKYRILPEPPQVAQPLKVNLPQLVYTGVTTFSPFSVVEEGTIVLATETLWLVHEPPHPLKSLKLNAKDARLLAEIKRGNSLDGLCSITKAPLEDVLRRVYALHVLGYLDLASRIPPEPKPHPQPAPRAEAVGAAPAPAAGPSPEELERLKNEVMSAYLRYRSQDPFDLFGLPEDATAIAVRDAFLAWSEKFAPWRYDHAELAPLAEKARDLFTFGARAFAQLADSEQRTLILKRRAAAREAAQRKRSTDFSIKTDLLDAKKQHDEGMARLARGDTHGAIEHLEFASDCDPRNALYRARLAYARFVADPAAAGRLAIAELGEALRIDPACAEAWYLAGEIYRWANDLVRAEDALRKASKLAPGDRRPVEALKSVLLSQKKR
ncbi:MAG: DUF4388 domain-containing protein [Myxococcales bacterium]|jgi:hypothetical protein